MNVTLHAEDAHALDLLLDRSQRAVADGPLFAAAGPRQERVRSAERVLGLLQWLPDTDPPHDLVDRTMRRIDQSAGTLRDGPHVAIDTNRPLA